MNASQNLKSGSTFEQHIRSLQLSPDQRIVALHEARVAEAIVDAIGWVCSKFDRPNTGVFAKPTLKY